MAHHLLTFIGKISWEGRSNGLPEEIYAFLLFDDANCNEATFKAMVSGAMVAQQKEFADAQAMFVQRDQGQIVDIRQVVQDRMMVPFKWIACITPVLRPLAGELSLPNEQGIEELAGGKVPVKN